MRWNETMKAAALVIAAERTTPPDRSVDYAAHSWNAYDVWLSRVRPPHDLSDQISMSDLVTKRRQDTVLRD